MSFFLRYLVLLAVAERFVPVLEQANLRPAPGQSVSHDEALAVRRHIIPRIGRNVYDSTQVGPFQYLSGRARIRRRIEGDVHLKQPPPRHVIELAAVMAHEIGQLQYKDPRLSKGRKVLDAITRGGSMIGPAFGEIGALAVLGLAMINAVVDANELSPEKKLMEADTKAMNYMIQSGYDPQGLIDVLRRVTQVGGELMPYLYDLKQSRPVTQERLEHASNMFLKLPLHGKELSTNYKDYQAITKGIREIYRA